jgi:hypothetical protein
MPSTPPYVTQASSCRPMRALAASVLYDGASVVSPQRVHRSSGGLCVRYNGASAVMLLRAHERLGSLGPARWKHPNRSRKMAASCLPVYSSASPSLKATRKNGCRKRTTVPANGTPLNRLTAAVTPSSAQPTKPVVTHSAGGPSRVQERFGSAGPARRQYPNRGTQQSG